MGTLGPQGCSVPYDGGNEGHGGALATNVADENLLPGKLVDQMRANNPAMKVVVARIIPMSPGDCAECGRRVVALNNAIPDADADICAAG